MPKILYVDINTDIGDQTYGQWKNKMNIEGWKVHELDS